MSMHKVACNSASRRALCADKSLVCQVHDGSMCRVSNDPLASLGCMYLTAAQSVVDLSQSLAIQSVHSQRTLQLLGAAGEELLLDYSPEFWALQKKHMQDIRRHERGLQVSGYAYGPNHFVHLLMLIHIQQ